MHEVRLDIICSSTSGVVSRSHRLTFARLSVSTNIIEFASLEMTFLYCIWIYLYGFALPFSVGVFSNLHRDYLSPSSLLCSHIVI